MGQAVKAWHPSAAEARGNCPVGRKMGSLSCSWGQSEGRGGSLCCLDHFGGSQAEGPAGCRESVPAAAVTGATAQAPAAELAQCGPTVLDLRQSMVRRLAHFAPYCEARNGAEVASTGVSVSTGPGAQITSVGGWVDGRFPRTFRPSSDRWPLRTGSGVKKESKPNSQDWDLRLLHGPSPST
jgi:hypothetical protein